MRKLPHSLSCAAALVVATLTSGCRTSREAPTEAGAATVPSAAIEDAALVVSDASPDPPDVDKPAVQAPALGWVVAERSPKVFDVHHIEGALFLGAAGRLEEATAAGLVLRSRFVEADGKPATVGWIHEMHGHWPTQAWAWAYDSAPVPRHDGRAGPTSYGRLVHWKDDRWVVEPSDVPGVRTTWSDGRVLVRSLPPDTKQQFLGGAGPLPEFSHLDGKKCETRLGYINATAITNAHVFALAASATLGSDCSSGEGGAAVEHFMPGNPRGQLVVLPSLMEDGTPRAKLIDALAPDDVMVAGFMELRRMQRETSHPYLTRYDGERWSVVPAPPTRSFPVGLARSRNGTIWIATSTDKYGASEHRKAFESASDLWRRPPSGPWERVPLPVIAGKQEPRVFDVGVDASGAVWVSAVISDTDHALLRLLPRD